MTDRRFKGEGTLFKRADGYWVGGVELPTTDGRRRQKRVTARDRNTCIDKLKKLRREIDDGRIPVTGRTTVAKWLDRWLNEIHVSQIRPTTRVSYAATIRLYVNPVIGTKRLDRLTPENVRGMLKDARAVSTRAQEKAYIVLKRALDDAVKEGLISRNVAAVVHPPKHVATKRTEYTFAQAQQLTSTAAATSLSRGTRWAAAFLAAGRQGELLGLTWDRVDLTHGFIDLEWQLQQLQQTHGCGDRHGDGTWPCGRVRPGWCPHRHWDFQPDFEYRVLYRSIALTRPKTKAGFRRVPLLHPLWVTLEELAGEPGDNPHNLVWHHANGNPIGPRQDYEDWQELNKACGLPTPVSLHRARHSAATILRNAGVDEQTRMEILGHVSADAQRIYAHADIANQRAAMEPLGKLLQLG